jgi:methylated-DNA-[protein]-cysteine S-methyltransferase
MHSALVESSLGQILLQATSAGLSGLYFVGQKDCPPLPGLPMAQGDALKPRAGQFRGRPMHSMRIASGTEPGGDLMSRSLPSNWVDSHLRYLDDPQGGQAPAPNTTQIFQQTLGQLNDYFQGKLKCFTLALDLSSGTDFQQRIWNTLLAIPYGDCWSYGQLARAAGYGPGYGRAAGAAVGANPITIIVPCHRVVAGNMRLNGYSGGLHRKLALLQHEGLAMAA